MKLREMSDRYRPSLVVQYRELPWSRSTPSVARGIVLPKGLIWLRSFMRFLAGRVRSGKIIDTWGRMTRDLTALVGIRAERVRDRNTRPLTPRDSGGGVYERPWIEFEWDMRAAYDGSQLARDNRRRFREQQLQDFRSGKIQTLRFS